MKKKTQRVIKFRAWGDRKQWEYFTLIELQQGQAVKLWYHLSNWCQFTGLLDSRGKEIYEGDIVRYTRKKWFCDGHKDSGRDVVQLHEIYYCDLYKTIRHRSKFGFQKNKFGGGGIVSSNLDSGSFNDYRAQENIIRVIGNIYQNPELLK